MATGKVTDVCYPRHRHTEFLKFLREAAFRQDLYRCFTARADELFELADSVLCAE